MFVVLLFLLHTVIFLVLRYKLYNNIMSFQNRNTLIIACWTARILIPLHVEENSQGSVFSIFTRHCWHHIHIITRKTQIYKLLSFHCSWRRVSIVVFIAKNARMTERCEQFSLVAWWFTAYAQFTQGRAASPTRPRLLLKKHWVQNYTQLHNIE